MSCCRVYGIREREQDQDKTAFEDQKEEDSMIGVILKIVLICALILLVVTLAGAVALMLFIIIDYISDTIREWERRNDDA